MRTTKSENTAASLKANKRAKAIPMRSEKPVKAVKPLTAQEKLNLFGIDRLCEMSAECVPVSKIAAAIGVHWLTMMRWIDEDTDRVAKYARAREAQADRLSEDLLSIVDDSTRDTYIDENGNERTNQEVVARSRLRMDARKWLASKMAPKKYGEKLQTEHTGPNGGPVQHIIAEMSPQDAAKVYAEMIAKR